MISALLVLLLASPTVPELAQLAATRPADPSLFDPGLSAADAALRAAAVRGLGRLQNPAALPRLEKALDDPEHTVRLEAALAWGQLEEAPAKALVERIEKEVAPPVRVRMVEALGKLKTTDVPFLIEAGANDADHDVRRAARVALGLAARRTEGDLPALEKPLLSWLRDDDPRVAYGAAYAAMRAEKLVSPALRDALLRCADKVWHPDVKSLCVRALGRFDAKAAAGGCEAGDAQAKRKCGAAQKRARARLRSVLKARMGDDEWRVAVEAWRATRKAGLLAEIAPFRALPGDITDSPARLAGPRLHVWIAALDAALAEPLTPRVERMASKLYEAKHTHPREAVALGWAHVRCRAAALLDRKGGDRLKDCHPAAPKGLKASLLGAALADLSPADRAQQVVARFNAPNTPVMRVALLDLAGALKGQPGIEQVVTAGVADADMAVFSQAAASAGKLALTGLARFLRDRVPALQKAAEYEGLIAVYEALGAMKDGEAKPLLREGLKFPNAAVAAAAAKALKALGEDAAPAPAPAAPRSFPAHTVKAVNVRTNKGDFRMKLHVDAAPITVANFVALAGQGYYDGLPFHRVVSDFVVQGGDPRGDGWGGPGYAIPCEINGEPYRTGAVGMALAGKDTGGSQWFVTHSPQPHLDGRYTVFGQVTHGLAVVDTLAVGDRILGIEPTK